MSLVALLVGWGVPARFAKPLLIVGGIALLLLAAFAAVKIHDHTVIKQHEHKAALPHAQRERKADANLQTQKTRDDAATQQRQQEIDNATRNIPDQAPSARQRARVCLELQRQAKQRGKPVTACQPSGPPK
jgi:Skp family chaperone for outer membrane proteins